MKEFDFCVNSRVIKEIAPEEANSVAMNGWDFTSRSPHPYRRTFSVKLHGIRWYTDDYGRYDITQSPDNNAARLLKFYAEHRLSGVFYLNHEHYGRIECRFKSQVNIEPGLPSSGGLVEPFEVMLIHHNPRY